MMKLGYEHKCNEWRLFIDSSKASLKAVLLHNGNIHPPIPVAHAVQLKETYDTIKLLLTAFQYPKYSWKIFGDLKVISIILGLHLGYTNICVFCASGILEMTVTILVKCSRNHEKHLLQADLILSMCL